MKQLVASMSNETTVEVDSFSFCAWINIIYDICWLEEYKTNELLFLFRRQNIEYFPWYYLLIVLDSITITKLN